MVYPVSIGLTRFAGAALAGFLILGALGLWWHIRPVRLAILAICGAAIFFLKALPSSTDYDRRALQKEVARAVLRYEGVRYVWGGENYLGVDCSGLVRRGAIEGIAWYGLKTGNPMLIRTAVTLWWNDCSAKEMASGAGKLARKVTETVSIITLRDSPLHPGDFAITKDGVHALVYVGDHLWLEADPGEMKVVQLHTGRDASNQWFQMPVTVMRWRCLN